MHLERSIEIAAPPTRVWEIMSDVERWHEWTASITSVQRLDSGPFGVGSRALVRQPRLRPATFEVTEFEPGHNFTWATRSGGLQRWVPTKSHPRPADLESRSASISRAGRGSCSAGGCAASPRVT